MRRMDWTGLFFAGWALVAYNNAQAKAEGERIFFKLLQAYWFKSGAVLNEDTNWQGRQRETTS